MERYVCAFRGRRDYYQVPIALAEQNRLDQFITDFYATDFIQGCSSFLPLKNLRTKINFRWSPEIPASKVKCLWGTTFLEQTRHALKFSPAETFAVLDRNFSFSAASRAQATKSNLLMYEPYAMEAFQAKYSHDPHKVLFQFHPHIVSETELLNQDLKRFPYVQQSYLEQTGQHLAPHFQARIKDCWKHADLILCASSFTQRTLVEVGADPEICKVIPYGISSSTLLSEIPQTGFQVLFVGAGVQRKGLHHLLIAWQQARLPKESMLTLVCRLIDPGIEAMVAQIPGVQLIRGMDQLNLNRLFQTSSLMAMPSIVEGFGQVYLESLSYGCPVLGTKNTCLPDLGDESDGIFLTEVSDIDYLTAQLERLAPLLSYNPELRRQSQACAAKFSWQAFRSKLCSFL
jgi:glycosyltransferase involved in cell wall biosynthesis